MIDNLRVAFLTICLSVCLCLRCVSLSRSLVSLPLCLSLHFSLSFLFLAVQALQLLYHVMESQRKSEKRPKDSKKKRVPPPPSIDEDGTTEEKKKPTTDLAARYYRALYAKLLASVCRSTLISLSHPHTHAHKYPHIHTLFFVVPAMISLLLLYRISLIPLSTCNS